MNHVIKGGTAFSALQVNLQQGEWLKAESNAMMAMSGNVTLSARADGGILRGLARKFSGESFFFQEIRADKGAGWVMLAPVSPGAVAAIELDGNTGLTAEKGSFLAATEHVTISSTVQSLGKAFFGGEGFVVVKIGGRGTVFLGGFGAVEILTLEAGQEIVVDNTHLIAWEDGITYNLGKGGTSWTQAFLGGEVIAARLKGPGRVWVQTRTLPAFRGWLGILPSQLRSVRK
jgi:uncharacterized protein (TIGR00266 family)